jgi:energy-coupling factor transporter ATP-binding protein EcfA2
MFDLYTRESIERDFLSAKELYKKFGVNVDKVLEQLAEFQVSMHCWQGDDVEGLEVKKEAVSGGGIMATGNYPGRARNGDELRADMEKAMSLIPGKQRINLHASYAETDGVFVERDELRPEHFQKWIDGSTYNKNLNELTELLDIGEIIRTPARQLSLGQRMRCEIAASLLHSPRILFLDEPTIGLDAVSKTAVRQFIKTINKERKTTVILTTHDMQDIEALTERIILIGKGKILLDGILDQLKKRNSTHKKLSVDYLGDGSSLSVLPDGMHLLDNLDGHAKIAVDTSILPVSNAIACLSKNMEITDISITGSTVEEMVVTLYEEFQI